jgi:hypothetical protein
MSLFQRLEFPEQPVVFGVRNLGVIHHIVVVVEIGEALAQ